SRARLGRGGAAVRAGRPLAPRRIARARPGLRTAARRLGRRAHAPALAPGAAGHAHRDPAENAGARLRPRAPPERRAPPAAAHAPRADLPARAPFGNGGDRRALSFLAGRAALRIPRGAGSRRRDADELAAQAHRAGIAEA